MPEIFLPPPGWVTTYVDPSLRSKTWELKEDLLQLHHPGLNRVADLGWYRDHFTAVVYQPDFQGALLGERQAHDPASAFAALQQLLETFGRE
jgi:hypothetical protein